MAYPAGINALTVKTDGLNQIIYAAHLNAIRTALLETKTELGDAPKGSAADLQTRLAITLTNAGGFKGPQQVKIVAKANGEYTTIQAAINAIDDESAAKPYTVLVFPGVYVESVTLAQYISLFGFSEEATTIQGTFTAAPNATVQNVALKNLSGVALSITGMDAVIKDSLIIGDSNNGAFITITGTNTDSQLKECIIQDDGGGAGTGVNVNGTNIHIARCTMSVEFSYITIQAAKSAFIYHCLLGAAIAGAGTNHIAVPYNAVF